MAETSKGKKMTMQAPRCLGKIGKGSSKNGCWHRTHHESGYCFQHRIQAPKKTPRYHCDRCGHHMDAHYKNKEDCLKTSCRCPAWFKEDPPLVVRKDETNCLERTKMPTLRNVIEGVINNTSIDHIVTQQNADELIDELVAALEPHPMRLYTDREIGPRMRMRFAEQPGFMSYNSDTRPLLGEVNRATQVLAQIIGECVPENRHQELALEALETVQLRTRRAFDQTAPTPPIGKV